MLHVVYVAESTLKYRVSIAGGYHESLHACNVIATDSFLDKYMKYFSSNMKTFFLGGEG